MICEKLIFVLLTFYVDCTLNIRFRFTGSGFRQLSDNKSRRFCWPDSVLQRLRLLRVLQMQECIMQGRTGAGQPRYARSTGRALRRTEWRSIDHPGPAHLNLRSTFGTWGARTMSPHTHDVEPGCSLLELLPFDTKLGDGLQGQ